jgi:hypothetical protein
VPTPGFENALPDAITGLIESNAIGVLGTIQKDSFWRTKEDLPAGDTTGCISCSGVTSGPFRAWTYPSATETEGPTCTLIEGGMLSAGDAPCSYFAGCAGADPCAGAGWSEVALAVSSAQKVFTRLSDESSAIIIVPVVEASA